MPKRLNEQTNGKKQVKQKYQIPIKNKCEENNCGITNTNTQMPKRQNIKKKTFKKEKCANKFPVLAACVGSLAC